MPLQRHPLATVGPPRRGEASESDRQSRKTRVNHARVIHERLKRGPENTVLTFWSVVAHASTSYKYEYLDAVSVGRCGSAGSRPTLVVTKQQPPPASSSTFDNTRKQGKHKNISFVFDLQTFSSTFEVSIQEFGFSIAIDGM